MTAGAIARHRLANQRLVGPGLDSPEAAVRWLCAVQSQDYPGAKWGIAQRTAGTSDAAIDRLFDEGRILRTHVMRPTWHFVAADDVRWLLELTRPRVEAANAYQYRKLELDDALFARTHRIIEDALGGTRFRTRKEIGEILGRAGIVASGPRLAYILMRAELDGLVCSGPLRGKQFTYGLLEERSPLARRLGREEALSQFTRRYFVSRGPATAHDFAKWSGLTIADAKAGIELVGSCLESEAFEGRRYWFSATAWPSVPASPVVRLLPNYDEMVSAYRDYGASFHPELLPDLNAHYDAFSAHFISVDGLIVGGWTRAIRHARLEMSLNPLVKVPPPVRSAIRDEVERYSRFLGKPVTLV